jgi:hypothetical protein
VTILGTPEVKREILKLIEESKCTLEEFDEACERYARYLKLIQIQQSVSKVELPKREKE